MSILRKLLPKRVPSATVSAVVIRCRCGDPASHVSGPCPQGVREDLGVIAKGKAVQWDTKAKGTP